MQEGIVRVEFVAFYGYSLFGVFELPHKIRYGHDVDNNDHTQKHTRKLPCVFSYGSHNTGYKREKNSYVYKMLKQKYIVDHQA